MGSDRQLHEEGLVAKDAVAAAVLMEQLEQPASSKVHILRGIKSA
jgi:hypothetical protein